MSDPRPVRPMPPPRTGPGPRPTGPGPRPTGPGPRPTGPGPRPTPPVRGSATAGAVQPPRPQRSKPDPNPMRIVLGMAGLASATALLTAMLPSVTPSPVADVQAVDTSTALGPQPSVIHVTKVVTLQPGQTAPPNSSVRIQPQPTPRVVVRTVTRQSGKP